MTTNARSSYMRRRRQNLGQLSSAKAAKQQALQTLAETPNIDYVKLGAHCKRTTNWARNMLQVLANERYVKLVKLPDSHRIPGIYEYDVTILALEL